MNEDTTDNIWPPEAGSPDALSRTMDPPTHLEDHVVNALRQQGLLQKTDESEPRHLGWLTVRVALAAAVCLAFLAVGVLIGRSPDGSIDNVLASLLGDETDLYAVLLYETAEYDVSGINGEIALFEEYNQWVALARQRGQFVTGEDLEVNRGWLVTQGEDTPQPGTATLPGSDSPLSGIFFLRGENEAQVLALVEVLPHVKHGGQVLVQKTIPTNAAPTAN